MDNTFQSAIDEHIFDTYDRLELLLKETNIGINTNSEFRWVIRPWEPFGCGFSNKNLHAWKAKTTPFSTSPH